MLFLIKDMGRNIDPVTDKMIKHNEDNQSSSVKNVMNEVSLSLSTILSFGRYINLEDQFYNAISRTFRFLMESGNRVTSLVGVSSLFKYILWWKWSDIKKKLDFLKSIFVENYETHERAFDGMNRDFTDSLLISKKEAEEEDKELKKYLDKWNIINMTAELVTAGFITTQTTLEWWMLYLCVYPEMQERIRQEVENILPNEDDMPTIDMRAQCPFMTAFTQEVLRIRPPGPFIPRKALDNAVINGIQVPAETSVIAFVLMSSEKYWPEPKEFEPKRFFDSNNNLIVPKVSQGWLLFGGGKRGCPGEKLAMTNLFLMQCRLIQKTRKFGCFKLASDEGSKFDLLKGDPLNIGTYAPRDFNIKIE